MNDFWQGIIAIATAIVGLAVIATLVSKNANTAGVVQSLASGLASDLAAAEAPVSGGGFGTNVLGYNSITNGGGYNNVY